MVNVLWVENRIHINTFERLPYEPTIVRCSNINITWTERSTSNPHSQAPYSIHVLRAGYQPILIGTSSTTAYAWNVQLPTGGPYLLYMTDANGYTGGNSLIFQVTNPASGTCGTTSMTETTLKLTDSDETRRRDGAVQHASNGIPATSKDNDLDLLSNVKVVDAKGAVGLCGIYTVTTGRTSCYNVASTVTSGATPTTLSKGLLIGPKYVATNTWTDPSTSGTATRSTTDVVIANTGTVTITSFITLPGGSTTMVEVAPGSQATVASEVTLPPSNKTNNLPVIVGSVVGGVGLVLVLLILFILHRRRTEAAKKRLQEQQEAFDRRRLSTGPDQPPRPQPYQINGHNRPVMSARESAPLLYSDPNPSHTNSPSPPATSSFYGDNGTGRVSGAEYAPWAHPAPVVGHPLSPENSGFSSVPPTRSAMHQQLPPGAAPAAPPPQSLFVMNDSQGSSTGKAKPSISGSYSEKATYRSSTANNPSVPAPPPYQ
ncbi:hypothetical protein PIIN_03943 [Serendipita indica DSM 11827]|uniref:Uncharacterized protein n=1 Tax=Serendipita indica (strain DSM 11827) TaxID=1109443 RepID=G4TFA2_SERID|nr:hypothetical protein PIIN_03943 [Serendipita indica DSM 11827]